MIATYGVVHEYILLWEKSFGEVRMFKPEWKVAYAIKIRVENFLISDTFSLWIPCGLNLIVQNFFFFFFFSLFWFFPSGWRLYMSRWCLKGFWWMGFQHYFEEKIIWFMHLTPHSFPNKKINNLFWNKFLFSYTYYIEPACFITLFHVWPQVLVQILSWWGACLLAMISLVSKAWSLLSFANDSLKNTATFYVNNYFIDWLMNVYYFFALRLGVAL